MYTSEDKEYKNDSRSILLMVLGVAILVVAVIGVSFAAFSASKATNNINTLTTGAISMAFQDTTYINIENAMPISDQEGMALTGDYNTMKFTVSANVSGSTKIDYVISAVDVTDDKGNQIPEEYLKIYMTGEGSLISTPTLYSDLTTVEHDGKTDKVLAKSSFVTDAKSAQEYKNEYELKMWIDEKAVIGKDPKTFKIKVRLDAEQK